MANEPIERGEMGSTYYPRGNHRLWGSTKAVMVDMIDRADVRLREAILEVLAAEQTLGTLRAQHTRDMLPRCGDRVVVKYSNGEEDGIYEGVDDELPNRIYIRHLTKKGKPKVSRDHLPNSMAAHIHNKPTGEVL